jgi:hypothetical protein
MTAEYAFAIDRLPKSNHRAPGGQRESPDSIRPELALGLFESEGPPMEVGGPKKVMGDLTRR